MIRIKPGAQNHGSIRDALAVNPWVWCDAGQHIVREREMQTADCCESCMYEYGERRTDRIARAKEQSEVLPDKSRERDENQVAPRGPIQLCLGGD